MLLREPVQALDRRQAILPEDVPRLRIEVVAARTPDVHLPGEDAAAGLAAEGIDQQGVAAGDHHLHVVSTLKGLRVERKCAPIASQRLLLANMPLLKVISWNLLRLDGAAVGDVAALLERERPDVMLMQEVTQHMDVLPGLAGGHYHRLPWPGKIHGLAAWSRHNFATPRVLPLPASRLPGRWPQRRAQLIHVGDITFANVHLSHGQLLNRRQLLRIAAALRGGPSTSNWTPARSQRSPAASASAGGKRANAARVASSPSLPFVIYGMMANVSVGALFLAGFFVYGPASSFWALCPDLVGARRAGTAAETTPVTEASSMAAGTSSGSIGTWNNCGPKVLNTHTSPQPAKAPSAEPKSPSTAPCTRNTLSICARRVPIARRMPISRVRSVTDTSMMFMMPIPPTRREIEAIAPNSKDMVFVVSAAVFAIAVKFLKEKSLSIDSLML